MHRPGGSRCGRRRPRGSPGTARRVVCTTLATGGKRASTRRGAHARGTAVRSTRGHPTVHSNRPVRRVAVRRAVHTPARARPYCFGRSLILCGRAEGRARRADPTREREPIALQPIEREAPRMPLVLASPLLVHPRRRALARRSPTRAPIIDIRSSWPLVAKEIETGSMKRSKDDRRARTMPVAEPAADPRFISALPRCDLWNAVIRCRRQSPAKPMRMGHCEHDTDGLASYRALRSHPFFIGADSLLPRERVSDPRSFSSEFSSEFSTRV